MVMNALANFGRDAGSGITSGINRLIDKRRYDEQMDLQKNRLAMMDQERQQVQKNRLAAIEKQNRAAFEKAEQEHFTGLAKAVLSAPEDQRQFVYEGGMDKANQMGFDVRDAPPYSPEAVYRLAGAAGVEIPKPEKTSPTNVGKLISERDALPEGDPRRVTYDAAIKKATTSAPVATVNIDKSTQAGMTEEQKALAKSRVSRFETLQNNALAAEEQNSGLSQIENMDISTGFGEGAKAEISRVVSALGGDGEAITGVDPANVQAFNAITGKLVLDVMSTQKGPQTDKDQERIAKTIPSIKNESLANKFNINSLKALNFRRMEMAGFYENFLEENGTLKGADRAWSEYKNSTPMLSDQIKNPENGLPMFYHEFKQKLMERNPGATEQQAINAWRELTQ